MKKIKYVTFEQINKANAIFVYEKLSIILILKSIFSIREKNLFLIINKANWLFEFKNIRVFDWNIYDKKFKLFPHKISYNLLENNLYEKIKEKKISEDYLKIFFRKDYDLIYKKTIIEQTYYLLNIKYILILLSNENKKIFFYQSNNFESTLSKFINFDDKFNFKSISPKIFIKKNYFVYLQKIFLKIFLINLFLFIPLFIFSKIKIKNKNSKKLGIRLYNNGIRMHDKFRRVDWPIQENYIKKSNVVFVAEDKLDSKFKFDIKKNEYSIFNADKKNFNIFLEGNLLKFSYKFFLYYFKSLKFVLNSKNIELIFYIKTFLCYFKWDSFIKFYNLKFYISYHDHSIEHIYRNLIFRENNCKSILYKHTFAEDILNVNQELRYILYSYTNYDVEYHWGERSANLAKKCLGKSFNYDFSKPIWSSKILSTNRNYSEKPNIGVFPSAFGSGFINSENDHFVFLKSLKVMIVNNEINTIYFKPKKGSFNKYLTSNNSKIRNISNVLFHNKRFKIINNKHSFHSVIEKVDLSISMPFSSPTIEILCSGKKAFYFDAASKYLNSYYDQFSNLVCHDIKDISIYIDYWLNLSEEELAEYYDNKLKKHFGDHDLSVKPKDIIYSYINDNS